MTLDPSPVEGESASSTPPIGPVVARAREPSTSDVAPAEPLPPLRISRVMAAAPTAEAGSTDASASPAAGEGEVPVRDSGAAGLRWPADPPAEALQRAPDADAAGAGGWLAEAARLLDGDPTSRGESSHAEAPAPSTQVDGQPREGEGEVPVEGYDTSAGSETQEQAVAGEGLVLPEHAGASFGGHDEIVEIEADDLPWIVPEGVEPPSSGTSIDEAEPAPTELPAVLESAEVQPISQADGAETPAPSTGSAEFDAIAASEAEDRSAWEPEDPRAEESAVAAEPDDSVSAPIAGPTAAVEDFAARLERIAASLREKGVEESLREHRNDPVAALLVGYLAGLSGAGKEGGG